MLRFGEHHIARKLCYAAQDVDEALKRLPQEEVDARNQRLKRASDCSLKKAYLPEELQAVQTPYRSYLGVRPARMRPARTSCLRAAVVCTARHHPSAPGLLPRRLC